MRRIKQHRRETGQIAAKTTRDRTPKWQAWADWLLAKIDARPDIYLRELQADLKAERGEEVCLQTICNACAALMRHESIDTTLKYYVGRNAQTTADVLSQVHERQQACASNTSGNSDPKSTDSAEQRPDATDCYVEPFKLLPVGLETTTL